MAKKKQPAAAENPVERVAASILVTVEKELQPLTNAEKREIIARVRKFLTVFEPSPEVTMGNKR